VLAAAVLGFLAAAQAVAAAHAVAASPEGNAVTVPLHRAVALDRALPDPQMDRTRLDRIVVKFAEGSFVRLRGGALTSVTGAADLRPLYGWLGARPEIEIARHFARDEAALDADRERGQRNSRADLADLNLYYQFRLPAGTPATAIESALRDLRAFPFVETAFVEPVATPPVIDDPRRGVTGGGRAARGEPGLPTPDYSGQQGYLYAPPNGINAQAVWGFAGGRGATLRIIDIEGAWLWSHEDLKAPFFEGGAQVPDLSWRNHGTAVMGEMVGGVNGFGVTGIATDLEIGSVSIATMSVAAAIDLASANLSEGDLFLIELHAPGPNANGSGQFGYVPMEYWQDNFDAIQTAVANGRVCIEAAGNGEQNLDDPVYDGLFDRSLRYSGAILVGAGTPTGNDAEWFTNYGSRCDLNGWGSSVVTCGYGDLQGGAETQWYTAYFGGTSSASPIVSGAVACLQGMCRAEWGLDLSGPLAMQLLYDSGTPWNGAKRIGRRPDLLAARQLLLQGVGSVAGEVRDAESGEILAGTDILFPDDDIFVRSDGAGAYAVTLLAGTHALEAEDFFHYPLQEQVTIASGEILDHDLLLVPKPAGFLMGTFVSQSTGQPVAGGTVLLPGTPIAPESSGISSHYTISGIPEGPGYLAVAGLIPGLGAAASFVDIAAGQTTIWNPILPDAESFEAGNGGYSGDAPWEWGAPSGPGPGGAFSGTRLWATSLSGNYGDNVTAYLTVPAQNFSGESSLRLTFTHWYEIEGGFDGGNVQIRQGGNWITIDPLGGYPMAGLSGIQGQSGYSGSSGGWRPAVVDLTPFIGPSVQVRFHFGSDGGVTAPGWYLDDVAFDVGDVPAAAPDLESDSAPALGRVKWMALPNPFRGSVTFELRGVPAPAIVRIYDPAGREVRSLGAVPAAAETQTWRWDGRDAGGRSLPAGAYLLRWEAGGRAIGSQRLIRLR
jgi:hypothetical protein